MLKSSYSDQPLKTADKSPCDPEQPLRDVYAGDSMDTATLKLNNGIVIPMLGFGTWLIPNDQAADTVCTALATMADRYDVGMGRLCVRYCQQHGLVALPKATNPDHIADYERDERVPVFHGKL